MAARPQLQIDVSDPGLAQSLSSFLEYTIYRPTAPEGSIVSVTGPEGLPYAVARAEVALYLKAWHRFHPEASASLID
jgi:hypothetical protein